MWNFTLFHTNKILFHTISNHSPLSRNSTCIITSFCWILNDDQNELFICKELKKGYDNLCFHSYNFFQDTFQIHMFTTYVLSLPGATIISCFLERMRRNVRSLVGSRSRTTLLALSESWLINPAYWTVVVLSIVVLIGIPVQQ